MEREDTKPPRDFLLILPPIISVTIIQKCEYSTLPMYYLEVDSIFWEMKKNKTSSLEKKSKSQLSHNSVI